MDSSPCSWPFQRLRATHSSCPGISATLQRTTVSSWRAFWHLLRDLSLFGLDFGFHLQSAPLSFQFASPNGVSPYGLATIRGGGAIFPDPRLCKHPRHAIALAKIYQPYRGCFIFDLFDSSVRVPDRICDREQGAVSGLVGRADPSCACFVLILFLSFTSWEYFERPVIGFGNRLAARRVEQKYRKLEQALELRTETPPAMTFLK